MTSNNETVSCQMPWAGNIAKTMTSNRKQFTVTRSTVHCYSVNRSLLTAVARDGWNLSAVFKFCFCFVLLYNKSLNDWSLGEQWILFPLNLNVCLGNKIHCSPRDQSLSVYCGLQYFNNLPIYNSALSFPFTSYSFWSTLYDPLFMLYQLLSALYALRSTL